MKVESGTSQLASWQLGIQGERVAVFTCLDALNSGYLRFQVMVPGSLGVWGTIVCEACILDRNSTAEEL